MKLLDDLRVAISFLTVIPTSGTQYDKPDDFGRSSVWFSIIGMVLGLILMGLGKAASYVFSPLVVGVLITAVWAMVTGGLHLDGLADSCDGLLSASRKERRLEIMKDPRLGTFGGIGLFLALLGKVILSAGLVERGLWMAFPLAAGLGRWFIVIAARQPMARPGGLGEKFSHGVQNRHIILSALLPIGMTIWIGPGGWMSFAAAVVVLILIIIAARRELGGMTGDIYGLMVELSELTVLLVMNIRGLW
jgi:adenosylcobinamide-GDP ribazoletransferase